MNNIFKYKIFFIACLLFLGHLTISNSQSGDDFAPIQIDIPCIGAQYDLSIGSRDGALFGEVMKLQLFLFDYEIMSYPPTGYFGPITQSALAKYQSLRNIIPTGNYDFKTRFAVAKDTCGANMPAIFTDPVLVAQQQQYQNLTSQNINYTNSQAGNSQNTVIPTTQNTNTIYQPQTTTTINTTQTAQQQSTQNYYVITENMIFPTN